MSSPTTYFWYRETLNISPSVDDRGTLNWWIVVSLLVAWLIVFLCMIKGIASSGKVCTLQDGNIYFYFFFLSKRRRLYQCDRSLSFLCPIPTSEKHEEITTTWCYKKLYIENHKLHHILKSHVVEFALDFFKTNTGTFILNFSLILI